MLILVHADSGGHTFYKGLSMKSTFAKTAAALAVLSVCSGAVNSMPITVESDLGTLVISPTSFGSGKLVAQSTAFAFGYSFTVAAPYTAVSASINWNPNELVPGFSGSLYSVTCSGLSCNTSGAALASFTSTDGLSWRLPTSGYFGLTPGKYAYYFTGTTDAVGGDTLFTGQSSARVPAPAVLGLVGLGLIGMGLGRKARRA